MGLRELRLIPYLLLLSSCGQDASVLAIPDPITKASAVEEHPAHWIGAYTCGNGEEIGTTITLHADGRFEADSWHCTWDARATGSWTGTDSVLQLQTESSVILRGEHEDFALPTRLEAIDHAGFSLLVPDGDRTLLDPLEYRMNQLFITAEGDAHERLMLHWLTSAAKARAASD